MELHDDFQLEVNHGPAAARRRAILRMLELTLPRLRDDVVVRPFDDRGLQPRYVVAVDGCHFIVTQTVAAVLEETRNLRAGERSFEALSARVARRLGKVVTPGEIEQLLNERAPKSFFEGADRAPSQESPLSCRGLLVREDQLQSVLAVAGRLFDARVASFACGLALVIEACLAPHIWSFEAEPMSAWGFLTAFALTLVGIFVHEIGHLAACHRFGGRHGGIGVGFYWCLPAFYAEVHGTWLLSRWHRAAVDAGGIYLQGLFVAILAVAQLIAPAPALLSAIAWSHLLILHTLNPVLKFDGYWLLCDLAGLCNLHGDLRRIARRLVSRHWPNRTELALLAAFALIAAVYFSYLLTVLGRSVGVNAAALAASVTTDDHSASTAFAAAGQAALLALTLTITTGTVLLLSRAVRDVVTERSSP